MAVEEVNSRGEILGKKVRDFLGVTGTITMGKDHNPEKDLVIMTVKDQKFVFYARQKSGSVKADSPQYKLR